MTKLVNAYLDTSESLYFAIPDGVTEILSKALYAPASHGAIQLYVPDSVVTIPSDPQFITSLGDDVQILCSETGAMHTYLVTNSLTANYVESGSADDARSSIVGAVITLGSDEYKYSGFAIMPSLSVVLEGRTLRRDVDYTVEYLNNIDAYDDATVKVNGIGEYKDTVEEGFHIVPRELSYVDFADIPTQYYTGFEILPELSLTYYNDTLELYRDYVFVSCTNNVKKGTAKLKIEGIGNYTGYLSDTFKIAGRDISLAQIENVPSSVAYDGTEHKFVPTVKYNLNGTEVTLVANKDYTVSYENVKDFTTASSKAKVIINGIRDYSNSIVKEFEIVPLALTDNGGVPISDVSITKSALTDFSFGLLDPFTVTYNGKLLNTGTDYIISYDNNYTNLSGEDGDFSVEVTLTFIGNYSGSYSDTCLIAKKQLDASMALKLENEDYSGEQIRPKPTVIYAEGNGGDNLLEEGVDYELSYGENLSVGTGTVTVTAKARSIYAGSFTMTFKIQRQNIAAIDDDYLFVISDEVENGPDDNVFEYSGRAVNPYDLDQVSLTSNDTDELDRNVDYRVTYYNNTKAGNASVKFVGIGGYSGTITKKFTITRREIALSDTPSVGFEVNAEYNHGSKAVMVVYDKQNDRYLTEGKDYTVKSLERDDDVGEYVDCIITGKGNYTGVVEYLDTIDKFDLSGAQVTVTKPTYSGSQLTPKITVKANNKLLKLDTDYTVSYGANVNAGSLAGSLRITAAASSEFYTGHKDVYFDIAPLAISKTTVNYRNVWKRTGSPIEPPVELTLQKGLITVDNANYGLVYTKNVNAGTANIKITGQGNLTGSINKSFTITNKDALGDAVFAWADSGNGQLSVTYTGSALTPEFTLTHSGSTLVKNRDYTLRFTANVNAGTGILTLTGKGNYQGTLTEHFTIDPMSLASAQFTGVADIYMFTGAQIKPVPRVKLGTKTLSLKRDYTLSYTDNTNPGDASVVITGCGNYEATASKGFTITPIDIDTLSLSAVKAYYVPAPASAQFAEVTLVLKKGSTVIPADKYTITSQIPNVLGDGGVFTISAVDGQGLTGTRDSRAVTSARPLSTCTVSGVEEQHYKSGGCTLPNLELSWSKESDTYTLVENTDYTVRYSNNKAVGTASVIITGKGKFNGSVTQKFKIVPQPIELIDIQDWDLEHYIYNGKAQSPKPTIVIDNVTLKLNKDYSLVYKNNINAGDMSVIIKGLGGYTGRLTVVKQIEPRSLDDLRAPSNMKLLYNFGDKPIVSATFTLDGRKLALNTDYRTSCVPDARTVGLPVMVTIEAGSNGNYTGSSDLGVFVIQRRPVSADMISIDSSRCTYTGSAIRPVLVKRPGTNIGISTSDYTITYYNNVNAGTATAVINGFNNMSGTLRYNFSIQPRSISTSDFVARFDSGYNGEEYNGKQRCPNITLMQGSSRRLVQGREYNVSYRNNVYAGTATVVCSGIGNYGGQKTRTFIIRARALNNSTVKTKTIPNQRYTGKAVTPSVVITDSRYGRTLVRGVDYTLTYTSNRYPGKACAIITGISHAYTGKIYRYFYIVQ